MNAFLVLKFIFIVVMIGSQKLLSQPSSPCEDEKYLQLKKVPRPSLTETERRYVDKMQEECDKLKGNTSSVKNETPQSLKFNIPKTEIKLDSTAISAHEQTEEIATPRNIGILTAITAILIGIAVAVGGITESPF